MFFPFLDGFSDYLVDGPIIRVLTVFTLQVDRPGATEGKCVTLPAVPEEWLACRRSVRCGSGLDSSQGADFRPVERRSK